MTEANDFMSTSRPLSRLDRPTRELILAARRERGRVLRGMIVSAARKLALVFASHRKQRNGLAAKTLHG